MFSFTHLIMAVHIDAIDSLINCRSIRQGAIINYFYYNFAVAFGRLIKSRFYRSIRQGAPHSRCSLLIAISFARGRH